MEIKFMDDEHKQKFNEIGDKMKCLDSYHLAVAYLFSLDTACREHINDVFDFGGDGIKPDGLFKGWQTSTSIRTTHLAFNLWNGYCYDGETYTDKQGYETDLPSARYTPDNIFCDGMAEYFFEAIKLRYPQYF
jgi:hypothetical protein